MARSFAHAGKHRVSRWASSLQPFFPRTCAGVEQKAKLRQFSSCATVTAVRRLRRRLDARVAGHGDVKEALMLALLAREHVLLEGPPGSAKTLLAEELAQAAGTAPLVLQFHRDTRVDDLLSRGGVLRREPLHGGGEAVSYSAEPGGVLTSDLCVLDDVSRAPGQALSALFRALSERRTGSTQVPLRTAIATASAGSASSAADGSMASSTWLEGCEQLDPALIDRFTLQLRVGGNLLNRRWKQAARVVSRQSYSLKSSGSAAAPAAHAKSSGSAAAPAAHAVSEGDIAAFSDRLAAEAEAVAVPVRVRRLLLRLVRQLADLSRRSPSSENASLLTDRTFLVKSIRVLRAKAASMGRAVCEPSDLQVLRFLTTFRVSPEVHEQIEHIIEDLLDKDAAMAAAAAASAESKESGQDTDPASLEPGAEEQEGPSKPGAEESGTPADKTSQNTQEDQVEGNISGDDADAADETGLTAGGHTAGTVMLAGAGHGSLAGQGDQALDQLVASMESLDVDSTSVENIEGLLAKVTGSIDRGRSELEVNSGGAPRRWTSWDPRDSSALSDVDFVDMHRWAGDPSPAAWPRAQQRMKRNRGGLLAVLRDTSMSMAGVNATWAARVVLGLLDVARQRHMRFGYIEFDHNSRKYLHEDGNFFGTDYDLMSQAVMNMKCGGWTNYERPLADAIYEFSLLPPVGGGSQVQTRHILLLSDGVPTHGDPEVRRQRLKACELGVTVHSIYLGWPDSYPAALEAISVATKGTQFNAFYEPAAVSTSGSKRNLGQPTVPRPRAPIGQGFDSGCMQIVQR